MHVCLWLALYDNVRMYHSNSYIGSHLSKLQLSKHVGFPNAFSKVTPTIFGYFCRLEAGCAVQMANIECFSALYTHCMALEDTGKQLRAR